MSQVASARQIVASVRGIPGYFAQVSGGGISSSAEKVYDGGSLTPETMCGVQEVENITVTRPYKPVQHAALLRQLRRQVGRLRTDVIVQDTDCDLVAVGPPRVYPNAVLVNLGEPEGDASSGSPTQWSLTFSVSSVGP